MDAERRECDLRLESDIRVAERELHSQLVDRSDRAERTPVVAIRSRNCGARELGHVVVGRLVRRFIRRFIRCFVRSLVRSFDVVAGVGFSVVVAARGSEENEYRQNGEELSSEHHTLQCSVVMTGAPSRKARRPRTLDRHGRASNHHRHIRGRCGWPQSSSSKTLRSFVNRRPGTAALSTNSCSRRAGPPGRVVPPTNLSGLSSPERSRRGPLLRPTRERFRRDQRHPRHLRDDG